MVKEMQKVKDETKEPELITVKEAAETLNLSEAYVRKIKDKLPHVKQGNNKQGRILFVKYYCPLNRKVVRPTPWYEIGNAVLVFLQFIVEQALLTINTLGLCRQG